MISKNNKINDKGEEKIVIVILKPLNKEGNDKITPKKEDIPLKKDMIDKEAIFAKAISLLFIGVKRIKDRVFLSFSPAIASGAIDIMEENNKEIVKNGNIKEIID